MGGEFRGVATGIGDGGRRVGTCERAGEASVAESIGRDGALLDVPLIVGIHIGDAVGPRTGAFGRTRGGDRERSQLRVAAAGPLQE